MEYQYIVNPKTNRKCRVNSALGQQIIKNYQKIMRGGVRENCRADKFTDCGIQAGDTKKIRTRKSFDLHPDKNQGCIESSNKKFQFYNNVTQSYCKSDGLCKEHDTFLFCPSDSEEFKHVEDYGDDPVLVEAPSSRDEKESRSAVDKYKSTKKEGWGSWAKRVAGNLRR